MRLRCTGCRGSTPKIPGISKSLTDELGPDGSCAADDKTSVGLTWEEELGESRDEERVENSRHRREEYEEYQWLSKAPEGHGESSEGRRR